MLEPHTLILWFATFSCSYIHLTWIMEAWIYEMANLDIRNDIYISQAFEHFMYVQSLQRISRYSQSIQIIGLHQIIQLAKQFDLLYIYHFFKKKCILWYLYQLKYIMYLPNTVIYACLFIRSWSYFYSTEHKNTWTVETQIFSIWWFSSEDVIGDSPLLDN